MMNLINWRGHPLLALFLRWYLGLVFLNACWHKLLHPASFALDVATYGILPLALVNPTAIILPWVELAAGIMLLIGYRARAGTLLVIVMMLVFIAALVLPLAQGLEISCGCFASQGLEEDPISGWTVLRDLAWLTAALYVFTFDRRPLGLDAWLTRRRDCHD